MQENYKGTSMLSSANVTATLQRLKMTVPQPEHLDYMLARCSERLTRVLPHLEPGQPRHKQATEFLDRVTKATSPYVRTALAQACINAEMVAEVIETAEKVGAGFFPAIKAINEPHLRADAIKQLRQWFTQYGPLAVQQLKQTPPLPSAEAAPDPDALPELPRSRASGLAAVGSDIPDFDAFGAPSMHSSETPAPPIQSVRASNTKTDAGGPVKPMRSFDRSGATDGSAKPESQGLPRHEASGQARTRTAPDGQDREFGKSIHVYARKAALCFAQSETRENGKGEVFQTLSIEGATAISEKVYDWKNSKIMLQLTYKELPYFLGVLIGALPSMEFKNHGPANDKGFSIELQKGNWFAKLFQKDQGIRAVPIEAFDAYSIMSLTIRQMKVNDPHLEANDVIAITKQICKQHLAKLEAR
jgi:hypothetical protein